MTINRALSILVHGDSKVGKSTLGNSTPAPRLLVDAEAAYRFLPEHMQSGKMVFWDPHIENPPEAGEWETCVVKTFDFATMKRVLEWLNSGVHPFRSVTIDSISEIQSRAKDDLTSSGKMTQQLWGDLLYEMDKLVRGFRDLTEHPTKPLEAVVLTAMTQAQKDGKYRPYVQGQLAVKLPYFLDVLGYLYVDNVQDPSDPTAPAEPVRRLLVAPHDLFQAGERVGGRLGTVVTNPKVTDMLDAVFGSENNHDEQEKAE